MKLFKSKKRLLITGAVLVIVIVILMVSFSGSDDSSTSVQADLAYIDDIAEVVTASGRIQPLTKVDKITVVSTGSDVNGEGTGVNRVDDPKVVGDLYPESHPRQRVFRSKGSLLVGDVHPEVAEVAGWLSPRIGGVGPMTRAMLLVNAVTAAERAAGGA